MLELAQSFLLGADQFPAKLSSLFTAGNLGVHLCHELVALLPLAAQQAPIEQVRALPIAGDRWMYLAQVDARAVLRSPLLQGELLFLRQAFPDLVGRKSLILSAGPVDDNRFWQIPLPEQDQGSILPTIGEDEQVLLQTDGAALVLDFEVPLAAAWRSGVGVRLAAFSPAGKPGKEGLDGCIHAMGMQQMIRIGREEPHQMPGFEPEAFVPDGAPEEDERAAIDLPRRMSQSIELGGSAQLKPAHGVLRFRFRLCCTHTEHFFLICLKLERRGLKPKKTRLSARPKGTAACSGLTVVKGGCNRITYVLTEGRRW